VRKTSPYGAGFYQHIESGSEAAARRVLPLIFDLVSPKSMVDLGCGDGSWLSVASALGVDEVLGVDGPWVEPSTRKIPEDRFLAVDLSEPFSLTGRFDMAMSLEVAEHIPSDLAGSFVEQLTTSAPVVLFGAAVPGQGGTNHVNERWADHWVDLFADRGFRVIDLVRPALWDDEAVEAWYVQNTFVFASSDALAQNGKLADAADRGLAFPLRVVHPRLLERVAAQPEMTIKDNLRRMPQAARTTLANRLSARRARASR
jgi:Methyltransferase domain